MFDLLSGSPILQTMDRAMLLASRRMGLIASNMANIDTPGYRTQDFSFQDALKQQLGALGGGGTKLTRTQPGHLTAPMPTSLPPTRDALRPSAERNDGNDVSLDRESVLLARTQGQYQLASSFAQTEIRRAYQVIREGTK